LTCLATCPDYSVFQSVPKLLVCLETFQSVLEYLKFVSKKISNICFRNISKLFRNSKTFFKSIPKHSDLFSRLSYFQNVSKLSVYIETFRFVLKIFKKVFPNIQIFFLKKVFLKHYNLFSRLFCYQNVLKHSDLFGNIPDYFENISNPPKHSNECRHSNYSGTIWNVIMSNFIIYRLFSKQI